VVNIIVWYFNFFVLRSRSKKNCSKLEELEYLLRKYFLFLDF